MSHYPYGFHTTEYAPPDHPGETMLPRQPTYRIYSKANDNYCVTIRNGNVVLAPTNKNDGYQVCLCIYTHIYECCKRGYTACVDGFIIV
jgi:hypothetical protein